MTTKSSPSCSTRPDGSYFPFFARDEPTLFGKTGRARRLVRDAIRAFPALAEELAGEDEEGPVAPPPPRPGGAFAALADDAEPLDIGSTALRHAPLTSLQWTATSRSQALSLKKTLSTFGAETKAVTGSYFQPCATTSLSLACLFSRNRPFLRQAGCLTSVAGALLRTWPKSLCTSSGLFVTMPVTLRTDQDLFRYRYLWGLVLVFEGQFHFLGSAREVMIEL